MKGKYASLKILQITNVPLNRTYSESFKFCVSSTKVKSMNASENNSGITNYLKYMRIHTNSKHCLKKYFEP